MNQDSPASSLNPVDRKTRRPSKSAAPNKRGPLQPVDYLQENYDFEGEDDPMLGAAAAPGAASDPVIISSSTSAAFYVDKPELSAAGLGFVLDENYCASEKYIESDFPRIHTYLEEHIFALQNACPFTQREKENVKKFWSDQQYAWDARHGGRTILGEDSHHKHHQKQKQQEKVEGEQLERHPDIECESSPGEENSDRQEQKEEEEQRHQAIREQQQQQEQQEHQNQEQEQEENQNQEQEQQQEENQNHGESDQQQDLLQPSSALAQPEKELGQTSPRIQLQALAEEDEDILFNQKLKSRRNELKNRHISVIDVPIDYYDN